MLQPQLGCLAGIRQIIKISLSKELMLIYVLDKNLLDLVGIQAQCSIMRRACAL